MPTYGVVEHNGGEPFLTMTADSPDAIPTEFGGRERSVKVAKRYAEVYYASVRAIASRMGSYNRLIEVNEEKPTMGLLERVAKARAKRAAE